MTSWRTVLIGLIVSTVTLSGCSLTDASPPATSLFDGMSVRDGSALLGPVIHAPRTDPAGDAVDADHVDDADFGHLAYLEVLGDPTDVWLDYQQLLADTYRVDGPSDLEACTLTTGQHPTASCDLRGIAGDDDEDAVRVTLRMWQPRQDFAGRYVLQISVDPYRINPDQPPSSMGLLRPMNDTDELITEIPAPRGPNAEPPQTGEQIGNGQLNDAYSLPLPDGMTVIRNLESGLGVDGISAYLEVTDEVDAAAIAEQLADRMCWYEPPVQWKYDGHDFVHLRCEGYAGDNPGDFYVIETPQHGTYFYFLVYID